MANVFIVGCGYVGTALAKVLLTSGHKVWGLRRDPSVLPKEITPIAGDLSALESLSLDFIPDFIFYMPSAGEYDESTYKAVYVHGTKNLVAMLTKNAALPKRVFYISSTSVYAQDDGMWVDETSIAEGTGGLARFLLQGEAIMQQAVFPTTVVRFGGIYGPGREYFLTQIKTGKMQLSPKPLYTNRIHRDDCAGMLQFLMTYPHPDNLYLGVDCEPALKNTVIETLVASLKVPLPKVASDIGLPEKRMRGNKRCSNQRLLAAGYKFKYPTFREGYGLIS